MAARISSDKHGDEGHQVVHDEKYMGDDKVASDGEAIVSHPAVSFGASLN